MNEDILNKVGSKIRELRKSKGLSQESLGEQCNFHFSYIGRIERGQKNISLLNLAKIATALNVSVNQFFNYPNELEKLTDKDEEIKGILHLLIEQDKQDIVKARNILNEVFSR